MSDPRAEYDRRLARWRRQIARDDRIHLSISNLRLALAAAIAAGLWLAFVRAALSPAWVLVPGVAFGAVAIAHMRVLQRAERARRAAAMYERAIDRLEDKWIGRGPDGARFARDHPFARDLDLFGRGSLFELINTARTEAGEETLASWFRAGAGIDEIRERQAAVDELRAMTDFREALSVLAGETEVSRTGTLAAWAGAPPAGLSQAAALTLAGCAAVAVLVTVLVFQEVVSSRWLLIWILAQSAIAFTWRRQMHRVIGRIGTPEHDLALLSRLLQCLERERFVSPRLNALQTALATGGSVPSRRIARLERFVSWLDSTRNQLFAPIAALLLLRSQLAVAIDRWHAANGRAVTEWLRVAGEFEALAALATYAYEHPHDPFPELVDRGPLLRADALGHPLLPERVAVRNDVALGGGAPQVIVVSGSNMSGKSTLLRAVGVNVVLALAGAPVRAEDLRLSPLAIGATLRFEDSLQEGHSRFYAEILRIRAIVDLARGPLPLLFLMDEILHGTNSHDRRIGAQAIMRALVQLNAIGLVTTHDLALTQVAATLGPAAVNMHFEDRIENGAMVFDYRMRPGVVEHSNALALMRAIGLDV